MLLFLIACNDPSKPDSSDLSCTDGEIRLASDGMPYGTLHDALIHAASTDRVCIGAGTFDIGTPPTCGDGIELDEGSLAIDGAGADRTTLTGHASSSSCRDLSIGKMREGSVASLSGLTLSDAAVVLEGQRVDVRDVVVRDFTTGWMSLQIDGWTYGVSDLSFVGNQFDYGTGFSFHGEGTVDHLTMEGNTFAEGYVGYFNGPVTWTGGSITDNVRTTEVAEGGYNLLEYFDAMLVSDVTFSGNRTNGPLLTGIGDLTGTNLRFEDDDATGSAVVATYFADYDGTNSTVTLSDSSFVRNASPHAAIGIYEWATLSLDHVDFGTGSDANTCDVAISGTCVASDLGSNAELDCDASGCG